VTAKRCTLDDRQGTKLAVLAKIAHDLEWRRPITNLDALYDVLRYEIAGPIEIVWRMTPEVHISLGQDLAPITATLREVAAERPDLSLEIDP
jgi:RNAse (barnase) inhibitor barstar